MKTLISYNLRRASGIIKLAMELNKESLKKVIAELKVLLKDEKNFKPGKGLPFSNTAKAELRKLDPDFLEESVARLLGKIDDAFGLSNNTYIKLLNEKMREVKAPWERILSKNDRNKVLTQIINPMEKMIKETEKELLKEMAVEAPYSLFNN